MAKIKLDNPSDVNRLLKAFQNNIQWLEDNLSKRYNNNDYHIQVAINLRTLFVDDIPIFFLIEDFLSKTNKVYVIDLPPPIPGVRQGCFSAYVCSLTPPLYSDYKRVTVKEFLDTPVAIIMGDDSNDDIYIKPMQVIKGFPNGDGGTHFGKEKPTIKILRESVQSHGCVSFNNDENIWGKGIIYEIAETILKICKKMEEEMLCKLKVKNNLTNFRPISTYYKDIEITLKNNPKIHIITR